MFPEFLNDVPYLLLDRETHTFAQVRCDARQILYNYYNCIKKAKNFTYNRNQVTSRSYNVRTAAHVSSFIGISPWAYIVYIE